MTKPSDEEGADKKPKYKSYIRYASIAYEMAAVIFIAILLGRYIDKLMDNETQIMTAVVLILFISAYFYKLVRDLSNK